MRTISCTQPPAASDDLGQAGESPGNPVSTSQSLTPAAGRNIRASSASVCRAARRPVALGLGVCGQPEQRRAMGSHREAELGVEPGVEVGQRFGVGLVEPVLEPAPVGARQPVAVDVVVDEPKPAMCSASACRSQAPGHPELVGELLRGPGANRSRARSGARRPGRRRPDRRGFARISDEPSSAAIASAWSVEQATMPAALRWSSDSVPRVDGDLRRQRRAAFDAVEGQAQDRGGGEVRVGRRVDDLHLDVGAVRVAAGPARRNRTAASRFSVPQQA